MTRTHIPVTIARTAAAAATALMLLASVAGAQIRGRPVQAPSAGWWISGGAAAAVISDINDGATGSTWKFGNDPRLLVRGSLEKALDEATTIGLAVAYGRIDVTVVPFIVAQGGSTAASPSLPAACAASCEASTEMWQALGQFRSGGGQGFHTFFEANGGVTSFRNTRTRDSSAVAIGKSAGTFDLTGTLGAGFGYSMSDGFAITLVQDFGIGFHSKTGLADGVSRSWRIRNTRAALRFHF